MKNMSCKIPTLLILMMCYTSSINSEGEENNAIEQIGQIFPNEANMDPQPGWSDYTFLLGGGEITREAVAFGLSAWFMNSRSFFVQIYRPEDPSDPHRYRLVDQWQIRAAADDLPGQQTISFSEDSLTCIHVQPGDRLGVRFRGSSNIPVSYKFDANSGIKFHVPDDDEADPESGITEISFDDIRYPYQISVAIFLDHDVARYTDLSSPTCRSDIPVPSQTLYDPPPQSGPSPQGEQGPTGETGPTGPRGAQGSRGTHGVEGATGPSGPRGRQGAAGDPGEPGAQGETGPKGERGEQGYNGTVGAAGQKGEQGVTGPQGPHGPAGPPGPLAQGDNSRMTKEIGDCEWCWKLYNPYIVLTNIIWLIVVTITLIVLICVVTCRKNRRRPRGAILGGADPSPTGFDNHYDRTITWEGSQKDLWKNYENGQAHHETDDDAVSKTGYDNPGAKSEDVYSSIQEGRTAF